MLDFPTSRRVQVLVLLCSIGISMGGVARAQQAKRSAEQIVLEYQVRSDCPNRREFAERVYNLTSKAEFAERGDALRHFSVSVSRRGREYVGKLEIDNQGNVATREVVGSSCEEVVSALALATALAVDPASLGGPPLEAPAKPETGAAGKSATKPPVEKPVSEPERDREIATPTEREQRRFQWLPALGVWVTNTAAPRLVGGSASVSLRLGDGPWLGLGLVYAPSQSATVERAEFEFGALQLELGAKIARVSAWELMGVASGELGRVAARGQDLPAARVESRAWGALYAGGRVRTNLPKSLFIDLDLGASFPLVRQKFSVIRADGLAETVHEVPALGVRFALAAGVTIW